MSDNFDDIHSYGELDQELEENDVYSKMMREWISHLPDSMKSEYTYNTMRSLKREQGIDAKRFMWLSDKAKFEILGLGSTDINLDYEE